jgi:cytochrome c-type biogenesis protein CcmE
MRNKLTKIIVSLLVVGGGVTYLLWSTSGQAFEYYKHVDEVVPELSRWHGKPMQLHGYVVPGSIQKRLSKESGRLEYKFKEINCGQEIDVYYAGVVPDTFKDGAEVVVKGELDGTSFHSTEVMAKCPSKYQATAGPSNMCTRGRAN